MGKKKKKDTSSKPSFAETLGFVNIFHNEKLNFFLGMLLFAVASYMILSFISFFTTGQADQSLIENLREGELSNEKHQFGNYCGSLGAYTAYFFIKQCFGLSAFFIPVFLFLVSLRLMRAYRLNLWKWFFAFSILMIWSSVTLALSLASFFEDSHFCPGGDHGLAICQVLEGYVGTPGLVAILALVALAFLIYISTETVVFIRKLLNPSKFIDRIKFKVVDTSKEEIDQEDSYEKQIETMEDPLVFDNPETETVEFDHEPLPTDGKDADKTMTKPLKTEKSKTGKDSDVKIDIQAAGEEEAADSSKPMAESEENMEPYDPKRDLENYRYPTLDLLKTYESDGKPYIDMVEQTANKNRIVEVLRNFGIEISSIKATVGPTITLYEITPAQGVRISKIRNLEDDIALSLKALGIRIIAPIPGKGTIGIEVPNAKASIVSMESVLNSKKFQETTMDLPCAMGKTITNEVFMFDLAKMPHLLVAGATGQGKSVGLNAILTSLLYKKHPAEMKIVLVDPKMVEFSIYAKIANHFLAKVPDENASPIITDTSKVVRTLQSLCVEMDARYELLMAAGERNIKDYNRKFIARKLNPEKGHKFMPYIVVVIDEYGDLIMTAGKEIELPIARIAQKARAVGIHMIIATQRPTTNIITGTIKANFPARIAFKVSQGIDSKTILDRMGAQQLIGRGDMLFLQGNEPIRVQCAFVDTPEVDDINQFIAQQQGYSEPFELPEPVMESGEDFGGGSSEVDLTHLDPMFEDAARLIVQSGSGSTSLIQRKFSIGYNRAGRLMDLMEKAGVVGAAHGSKPREVLIQDEMSLEQLLSSLRKN
jgi:S-DNA-T family DNA segregation ATPase FtsK/SpoIIIE